MKCSDPVLVANENSCRVSASVALSVWALGTLYCAIVVLSLGSNDTDPSFLRSDTLIAGSDNGELCEEARSSGLVFGSITPVAGRASGLLAIFSSSRCCCVVNFLRGESVEEIRGGGTCGGTEGTGSFLDAVIPGSSLAFGCIEETFPSASVLVGAGMGILSAT